MVIRLAQLQLFGPFRFFWICRKGPGSFNCKLPILSTLKYFNVILFAINCYNFFFFILNLNELWLKFEFGFKKKKQIFFPRRLEKYRKLALSSNPFKPFHNIWHYGKPNISSLYNHCMFHQCHWFILIFNFFSVSVSILFKFSFIPSFA